MRVFAVSSVKGGTGKSLVASNLALHLSKKTRVSLIDFDVQGSGLAHRLKIRERHVLDAQGKLQPIRVNENLEVMSVSLWQDSKGVAVSESAVRAWIRDCLFGVNWSNPDYVIIDTAASSSGELVFLNQLKKLDGVVLVLNDDEATLKEIEGLIEICAFEKIPVVAAVGNLVGSESLHGAPAVCSCGCGKVFSPLGSEGNLKEFCVRNGVEYVGSLPLSEKIRDCIQEGKPLNNNVIEALERELEK